MVALFDPTSFIIGMFKTRTTRRIYSRTFRETKPKEKILHDYAEESKNIISSLKTSLHWTKPLLSLQREVTMIKLALNIQSMDFDPEKKSGISAYPITITFRIKK
ncbi:hypothetical protein CHM34_08465 [Paludifilum halophilum]|uniref:Uncharacterized protein n=1 Tax=Paludifilum halophilum TaxID=1642702 RepID=A0A235B747_9BACL|nr:hypothetical protein CHM34_08465 [Paludifilum halophilum]